MVTLSIPVMVFEDLALVVFQQVGQSMSSNHLTEQLDTINSKLDRIGASIDELTLTDFRAAFRAIRDGLSTPNAETKQKCLELAEGKFRNILGIEHRQFAGHSAETVLAWSHFGLAFITFLRDDLKSSAKHILEAYCEEPRLSRLHLTPQIYSVFFAPECQELIDRYRKRLIERETATLEWHGKYDAENNKLQGISAHVAKAYKNAVYGDVGPALEKAREEIEIQKEEAIDDYCKKNAAKLLKSHWEL
jgi:hypothetical protein